MLEELEYKIELFQEQIENLEKSGHFTYKEIETQSIPLKSHLSHLKSIRALLVLSIKANEAAITMMDFVNAAEIMKMPTHIKYGMTAESYEEGKKSHNIYFSAINPSDIELIDASILTQKSQEK